jgi:salicylate hydroxylase
MFTNGKTAQHDLIIGADGIGSAVRRLIGINPEKRPAPSSCLHANVTTDEAVKLGLVNYGEHSALEYWGGRDGYDKIVLSPCNGGKLLSYYCFFPREAGDYASHNWNEEATTEELLAPYPTLDRQVFEHLRIGKEVRPWRLWLHDEYPFWIKKQTCLLGDAAHPMMPHQSQGACMAIEDSAALGIIFSKKHFTGDIQGSLEMYEKVRKPRATRVQAASLRATTNIDERIGKSSYCSASLSPFLLILNRF